MWNRNSKWPKKEHIPVKYLKMCILLTSVNYYKGFPWSRRTERSAWKKLKHFNGHVGSDNQCVSTAHGHLSWSRNGVGGAARRPLAMRKKLRGRGADSRERFPGFPSWAGTAARVQKKEKLLLIKNHSAEVRHCPLVTPCCRVSCVWQSCEVQSEPEEEHSPEPQTVGAELATGHQAR